MNIRKLVLPAVIAAALATPAFAQQQPQADKAKSAQSQEPRGKAGQKADAPKSDNGKSGKDRKPDPTREPEEEDDR